MGQSLKEQDILRQVLPYGVYVHKDGSETLFDRDYKPISTRTPDKTCVYPASEHPRFEWQAWFFNDENPPWRSTKSRRRCQLVMYYFMTGQPLTGLFTNTTKE